MTNSAYDRKKLSAEDVSKQEQEWLVRLMEEAAEVTQACAKTLRWGWASVNPTVPKEMQETNAAYLRREVLDFIDLAARLGILDNRGYRGRDSLTLSVPVPASPAAAKRTT